MKLGKADRIELIVSTDESRGAMTQLHLDVDNKCLIATDGHRVVKLPVTIDPDDTSGPISVAAIKAARKLARGMDQLAIRGAKAHELIDGSRLPRMADSAYPPYNNVIPDYSKQETVTLGLNAKFLYELARALGATSDDQFRVEITVPMESKERLEPIEVRRPGSQGIGVLMPMRLASSKSES